jgi:hypothetical protein
MAINLRKSVDAGITTQRTTKSSVDILQGVTENTKLVAVVRTECVDVSYSSSSS